jgi:hypothetical protein
MAQRQILVREMNQWMIPSREQTSPTGADAISSDTLNALRCILIEIEEASVMVAITASIAGAIAGTRSDDLTLQHLLSYLPPSPEVYRRHIDQVISAALAPSLVLPVQAYHARLSYALRLTRAIVDAGPAPTTAVGAAEIENVEAAWRHVCGTALGAISVLRDTLAAVRYSRPPVANEHAEALLRSAKAGGRPCVGDDGKVRMPRWAESRSHTRHTTQTTARVHILGTIHEVVIENASRTGLGLSGLGEAMAGIRVGIELSTGERLTGKIMWVRGERAGVQLETMLPATHDLLAGLNDTKGKA